MRVDFFGRELPKLDEECVSQCGLCPLQDAEQLVALSGRSHPTAASAGFEYPARDREERPRKGRIVRESRNRGLPHEVLDAHHEAWHQGSKLGKSPVEGPKASVWQERVEIKADQARDDHKG